MGHSKSSNPQRTEHLLDETHVGYDSMKPSTIQAYRGSDQFMLRFPDGMRDLIKIAAAENGRSMNSEIIARLASTLNASADATISTADFQSEIKKMIDEVLEEKFAAYRIEKQ